MNLARKNVVLVSIVAVAAMFLFATVVASGGVGTSRRVTASGVIASANLELYSDAACTQMISSIDWGNISPGSSVLRMIFVRNTGTVPLTLSMNGANWSPASASNKMILTWDREGSVLAAGQVGAATLKLVVYPSINGVNGFNVDIVISGSA